MATFDVHFEYDRDTNTLKLLNNAGNLLETFQLPRRSIQYRYNKNRGPGSGRIITEMVTFSDGSVDLHLLVDKSELTQHDPDEMTLHYTIE